MTTPERADRDFHDYLLSRLPETERDAVELRLLTDDDAYQAMLAAETDLLDAYVAGELDARDHSAFEEHVLPRSGTAERLAFARALQDYARQRAAQPERAGWADRLADWLGTLVPAPAPALRLATAALALVLVVAGGWFAWRTADLADQVAELQTAQGELAAERRELAASRDRLAEELAAARAAAADRQATAAELAAARARVQELERELASERRAPVAASFLLALATRSAGTPELAVPASADVVRLQLDTAGDDAYYDAFRVRLLGPDGAQVWSRAGLAADASTGTVDVELAADLLPTGRYEVLLDGVADGGDGELIGAYEFELKRSR